MHEKNYMLASEALMEMISTVLVCYYEIAIYVFTAKLNAHKP
jgi:hypothetical protein